MKKSIFAALVTLCSLFAQVPAGASTSGCPDSWILLSRGDVNSSAKFIYDQLLEIQKSRPQGDVVITIGKTKFISWKGEEGNVSEKLLREPPVGYMSKLGNQKLRYLYGKSEVETTYSVAVRGCASTKSFTEQRVWLPSIPITNSTLEEWVLATASITKDFTKGPALLEAVRKTEVDWTLTVKSSKAPFIWVPTIQIFEYFQIPRSFDDGGQILVIPMTPNCIGGLDGSTGSTLYIAKGNKCTFAFAVAEPGDTKLTVLRKFEIDSRPSDTTITCVKGKITKKVTAASPKCPSGYKTK
jgi:hypothetical protein